MITELESEIRVLIIDVLNLEDVSPEEIDVTEDLFSSDGLALDSIDALELGVAIQKKYGIKLDSKDDKLATFFQNVRSISAMIEAKKGE